MPDAATPLYTSTETKGSDRLIYKPCIPWPMPQRAKLRPTFSKTPDLVTIFNETDRPCDSKLQPINLQERRKMRARRQTPKGDPLSEEDYQ